MRNEVYLYAPITPKRSSLLDCAGGCGRLVQLTPAQEARHEATGEVAMCEDCLPYLPSGLAGRQALTLFPTPQSRHAAGILSDESHVSDMAAALGGRTAKPRKSIVIWAPDGRQQIILQGAGVTEVAELEDMALQQFDTARENMKKNGGRAFDSEDERERRGLPRREDVGVAMAEAFWAKDKEHRASPRTNPAPEPKRLASPVGKTVHTVGPDGWKEGHA